MSTYTLSGSGLQALSVGVGALIVSIIGQPAAVGSGTANPPDLYGVGTLRPGNATAFWEPFTVCGGPQWMPVPYGSTRLGYSFAPSVVVTVTEIIGSPPFAFPLASLPDVTLSSPADTQILTYQASTSKWINAAAPSGGGGGTGALVLVQTQTLAAVAASVTFSLPASGYSTVRLDWQTQLDGGTTPQVCQLRLNGDSGNNYFWGAFHGASGASTTGFGADTVSVVRVGNITPNSIANGSSAGQITIPDYQNTVWWKQIDALFWNIETALTAAQSFAGMTHGTWKNTAAVTSITLLPAANNFRIGSVFRLYGLT